MCIYFIQICMQKQISKAKKIETLSPDPPTYDVVFDEITEKLCKVIRNPIHFFITRKLFVKPLN